MTVSDVISLVSYFGWQAARPSTLIGAALVLGVVLFAVGRRRAGGTCVIAATVAMVVIPSLMLGHVAITTLEKRFPPPDRLPDHVDGIIVLGGAVSPWLTLQTNMPALNDAAERMTAFTALARLYPQARLVFTGGGEPNGGDYREADVAKMLFDQLGIAPDRVEYERQSINTWENAVLSRKLVNPGAGETWILVTSAFHMPRSFATFRKAGWPVVALPVDYRAGPRGTPFKGLDLAGQMMLLDLAVHEWIGLAVYRLAGRTDQFAPCPIDRPRDG